MATGLFEAFGSGPVNPNDLAVARAAKKTDPFVTEMAASEMPFAVFDAAKENRKQKKREMIYAEAEQQGLNPYDTPEEFYKYMSSRMLEEGDAQGSMRVQQMLEEWRVQNLQDESTRVEIASSKELTAGRRQQREFAEEDRPYAKEMQELAKEKADLDNRKIRSDIKTAGVDRRKAEVDIRKINMDMQKAEAELAEIPSDSLTEREYKEALMEYYKALAETAGVDDDDPTFKLETPKEYHLKTAKELVANQLGVNPKRLKASVAVADVAAMLANPGLGNMQAYLSNLTPESLSPDGNIVNKSLFRRAAEGLINTAGGLLSDSEEQEPASKESEAQRLLKELEE